MSPDETVNHGPDRSRAVSDCFCLKLDAKSDRDHSTHRHARPDMHRWESLPRLAAARGTDASTKKREQRCNRSCYCQVRQAHRLAVDLRIGQQADCKNRDAQTGADQRSTLSSARSRHTRRLLGDEYIALRNCHHVHRLLVAQHNTIGRDSNYPTRDDAGVPRLNAKTTVNDARWHGLRTSADAYHHQKNRARDVAERSHWICRW